MRIEEGKVYIDQVTDYIKVYGDKVVFRDGDDNQIIMNVDDVRKITLRTLNNEKD